MTLNHRVNRLGASSSEKPTALLEKYYLYRGVAIRSLSEQFDLEHKHLSDVVIAGILTLLLADVGPALCKYAKLPLILDGFADPEWCSNLVAASS
jgi:hypothetical protein